MSECVVRMEMPKEGCHTCDARCVSDLYGYICGIERKNVMPFLGKKNRPDRCPILCQLPDGHGRLVDKDEMLKKIENYHRYMTVGRESDPRCIIEDSPTIVPADTAERSET